MQTGGIDSSRIEAMIAQLRTAANRPEAPVAAPEAKMNFADVLKASLDSVNSSAHKAEELGKSFSMGDDSVSLSEVMISMQKASISLQATVQVRNKLVSAYQGIMNMQV